MTGPSDRCCTACADIFPLIERLIALLERQLADRPRKEGVTLSRTTVHRIEQYIWWWRASRAPIDEGPG